MRESYFLYVFEKEDPKLPRNRNVSNHYEKEEAHAEFVSQVEEYNHYFFYQAIEIVVNCIRNRFQQKDLIEALQTSEILLLKALREGDLGHDLQQMSSLFCRDLHKFKLETQLKTLTYIVDEKQVKIKDAITIISSLNASQKLLVSEVLKLIKLILTVTLTRH